MNWKDILRQAAPILGAAVGGPAGAVASKIIAGKLLGKPEATEAELAAAIEAADPFELRIKLRELDQQFARDMAAYDLEVEKVHAGDRANAREREAAVKDHMPAILASTIVGSFLALLFVLAFVTLPEQNRAIFEVLLGALGASVGAVVGYYFGSSKGSERKDQTIQKALNG